MKKLLWVLALSILVPLGITGAQGSTAAQVAPGYNTDVGCPGSLKPCFIPSGSTPLAGTQTGISLASATALTAPTGATTAIITVEGTNNASGWCARWRADGTAPTASAGSPIASGTVMVYQGAGLAIQLIQATSATCSMDVSYYK